MTRNKVFLEKGEQFMPKYEEINPFQKVPALGHNGFKLIERCCNSAISLSGIQGNKISIVDIVGACEVEQPRMACFNPREGRTQLTAWLERVAQEKSPHYDEADKYVHQIANK